LLGWLVGVNICVSLYMWKREFTDCLEKSTLACPLFDEALAIKRQHLPKKIYKYRRDCPNHRSNLESSTIWLSSPETYNDPYDCWLTLPDGLLTAIIQKRVVDTLIKAYELQNCLLQNHISEDDLENARKSREPLKTFISLIPDHIGGVPKKNAESYSQRVEAMAEGVASALQGWRKTAKLCSFSEVNNSMLMWSHYSEDHRGFCIEYDLEALNEQHPFRRSLFPIIYSQRLYDLTPFAEKLVAKERAEFTPLLPMLAALHKFEGWQYEREWRIVLENEVEIDGLSHPAPIPSRIFLGSRFEASKSAELLAICKQRSIAVFKMRLADDRFELLSESFVTQGD
jgi:hypothetical protein